MPAGTQPAAVREATAEAARELFEGHKYVFVLHKHQGAPHVHLSVRADRYDGVRLSPRKADLDRWRAVFARNLQDRGVNAVASRQPVRAVNRNYVKLWEDRAAGRGQLIRQRPVQRTSARAPLLRAQRRSRPGSRSHGRWQGRRIRQMSAWRWRRCVTWPRWRRVGRRLHGWRRSG